MVPAVPLVAVAVSNPAAFKSVVSLPAAPPTPEELATSTLVPVLTSAGVVGATVVGTPPAAVVVVAPPGLTDVVGRDALVLSPSSRIFFRMKKPMTTATTVMIVDAAGDPPVVWRGVRPV